MESGCEPGFLVMAGIPGTRIDDHVERLVNESRIRAFIIFSRNVEGPSQLEDLCGGLRELVSQALGSDAILAVDQEGGRVRRLVPPAFPELAGNSTVSAQEDPEAAVAQQASLAASMLCRAGIHVNFAPVLDLALDASARSGVLFGRCYGSEPEDVARLGAIYVETLQGHGVAAVAKHFPGIGRVAFDPHERMPRVQASMERILAETGPFLRAIEAGVQGIMTSHVLFPSLDHEMVTFSEAVCTRLLRQEMGFQGVLFSDDMEMGAVAGAMSVPDACVRAVAAGHDMVLVCSRGDWAAQAVSALTEALAEGRLAEERVMEGISRQEALLSWLRG